MEMLAKKYIAHKEIVRVQITDMNNFFARILSVTIMTSQARLLTWIDVWLLFCVKHLMIVVAHWAFSR
jgi:hypothetical protein